MAATAEENNEECVQYLLERGAEYHSAYTGLYLILFQSFVSNFMMTSSKTNRSN